MGYKADTESKIQKIVNSLDATTRAELLARLVETTGMGDRKKLREERVELLKEELEGFDFHTDYW